jgi:hypothetical protein
VKALNLPVGLRMPDPPEDQFNILLDEKESLQACSGLISLVGIKV